MNKPTTLAIPIGHVCNLKCGHCSIYKLNKSSVVSNDYIFKFVDWFKKLNSDGNVVFHGGEPLLNKNAIPIIEYVSNKKLNFCLVTNGTLINKPVSYKLKNIVGSVVVSLDSHVKEINNKLKGNDFAYDLTIKGIKQLLKNNVEVYTQTILSSKSIDFLIEYCDFSDSLGATPKFSVIEPDFVYSKIKRFKQNEYCIQDLNKLETVLIAYQKRYPTLLSDDRIKNIVDYFFSINKRSTKFQPVCSYKYIQINNSNDNSVSLCSHFHEITNKKIVNSFEDLFNLWNDSNMEQLITNCQKYCSINCMNKFI